MDLCTITETWIKQDDSMMAKEILPPGYSVLSSPHQGNRAGDGTALIYKDIFNVTQTATPSLTIMECSSCGLRFGSNCIKLYIIHRQPEGSVLSFCEEFATLLENDIMDTRNPIIVGDLNIHMEDTTSADTRFFMDVLESLNLQNRVGFPTHISKHTIYLIIHDKLLGGVANVQPGHFLPDHCLIHCTLNVEKPKQPSQVISYRKVKAINIKEFAMNISENMSNIANSTTVHEAVDVYNTILRQALDQHAPVKQKEIKVCHDLPWFNENIKEEIRL